MATRPQEEYNRVTLRELVRLYDCGELNLNPYYQRENTWDLARKRDLLFSLTSDQGYPVPAIYLDIRPYPTGKKKLMRDKLDVVDGKQRLTTILEFVKGQRLTNQGFETVPARQVLTFGQRSHYKDDVQRDSEFMESFYGLSFAELDEDEQNVFLDRTLGVNRLLNYSKEMVASIFSVLQQGQMLNNAEKARALNSPITQTAKAIEADYRPLMAELGDRAKRGYVTDLISALLVVEFEAQATLKTKDMASIYPRMTADSLSMGAVRVRLFLDYFAAVLHFAQLSDTPREVSRLFLKSRLLGLFVFWDQQLKETQPATPIETYQVIHALLNDELGSLSRDYVLAVRGNTVIPGARRDQAQTLLDGLRALTSKSKALSSKVLA